MSFLGLDVGTSSCKAVVFDRQGRQMASARHDYVVQVPKPGWAELDSAAVGDACLMVIQQAARQCAGDPVQGLAVSSQGEAFTVLNEHGQVLTNAMVSSDNRAAGLVKSWPQQFGRKRLYEKTGHTSHPIFSLFKLLWLRQERPDLWRRAARIFCFEDYIHYRLGLTPAISFSLAARTMLFNVRQGRWDSEILAEAGIREEQLAVPLAPGETAGILSAKMARRLGVAAGARVVAGGHDQVCAALGCGAIAPGVAALGSGSVECITAAFSEPVMTPALRAANLCTYPHAVPKLYATLAYNLTGGNLLRWYCDEWATPKARAATRTGADISNLVLAGMSDEPTSLMVLPYFTGSGTPHFDDRTPGAILGLRLGTKRGEVLRALLEGLGFELGVNLQILERSGIAIKTLLVTGGGAKNEKWLQLKADILNRPIEVPHVTEAGCLGCAMLVCAAIQGNDVRSLVSEWIQTRTTLSPDPKRAAFYAARYEPYVKTYESLRHLAPALCIS